MIEIYLKTNTNYEMNGDITLEPTSCTYKDSENLITLEQMIDEDERYKYVETQNVIAVFRNDKKQFFRIFNVVKSLDNVMAYARPLFFDLLDQQIVKTEIKNMTVQEILDTLLEGTGFNGHSNITDRFTIDMNFKNKIEALIGSDDTSLLKLCAGEYLIENNDIYINYKIGTDRGVRVDFNYNLNGIEQDISVDEVATRLIPVASDGTMLDENNLSVDSKNINKYTHPKSRTVKFEDLKMKESSEDEEGFEDIEELRREMIRRCEDLFESGLDLPTVNYKIDMVNLENIEEYKEFKGLCKVNKGDTLTCYVRHLDIDVTTRVIDFEEDLLTNEYLSIELGNEVSNFFDEQADIQNKVDNVLNKNGTVNALTVQGIIDATSAKFKALRDVAEKQHVRAMLFEDRVEDSPTFGCMCIGSMGFEIAGEFKPGTKEWNFKTFGTGQGFTASEIITGILTAVLIRNVDGSFEVDLSQSGGAKFLMDNKLALEMKNFALNFFDFEGEGNRIGGLRTRRYKSYWDTEAKSCIQLYHNKDGIINIAYENEEGRMIDYMLFDMKKDAPIKIYPTVDAGFIKSLRIGADVDNNDSAFFQFRPDYIDCFGNQSVHGNLTVGGTLTGYGNSIRASKVEGNPDLAPGTKIYDLAGVNVIYPVEEGNTDVVEQARRLIGLPYSQAYFNYLTHEMPPHADCSSLCQWAYYQIGKTISRTTYTQINEGTEIAQEDVKPGDMIFTNWSSPGVPEHVYMYSKYENGQHYCIEAPRTGLTVRERTFTFTGTTRIRRMI